MHYFNWLILNYKDSLFSSIFRPSLYVLAFKFLGLHFSALFWVKGALKRSSGYYKSSFENINNHICKKAAPAISAAFLTLMTLKLENNEMCALSTPNDHNDMKKWSKLKFFSPFDLAFLISVDLLLFLEFWHQLTLVVYQNVKSEHCNPENKFQLILVHCA